MPKCSDTTIATAVHVDTSCTPCPWPSSSDPDHSIKIENKRSSSLHDVETYSTSSKPGALLFGGHQDFMTSHSVISSSSTKSDDVRLTHKGTTTGQTVEVETTTTFYDATQIDDHAHNRYDGPKEVMNNSYEIDLP